MEFVAVKRNKGRRKKRHTKKRRREQIKVEVKSTRHRTFISEHKIFVAKEKLINSTMQADSFWKNYTAAHEWQKRHSVTWWRSRCFALEYENQILRDKLRSLVYQAASSQQNFPMPSMSEEYDKEEEEDDNNEETDPGKSEKLEFHVDEDMMNFLEQSIRHKIELKKKRESESVAEQERQDQETRIQGGAAWVKERDANAKLLYGKASPTILAMETALQTTVDRHKDKAKPQYWPIIPLKP